MQFERLNEFPVIVLFWRSPEHPVVRRRRPLLSAEIGTSIDQFSVDVLHTLHLGIFQDCILRALWLFVKTEHLVARTFFSVLSCRACLYLITHTCVWLKGSMTQFTGVMCCLAAHPKSLHLTACFHKHLSAFVTPSHQSVPHRHGRHDR